jgi:hypothetical protein
LSLPVLAVLAGILIWRKLVREFPFFFSCLIATEVATLMRLAAQLRTPKTYFLTYWISDLVITIFNFAAIYEIFFKRIFPAFYKVRFYRYLFPAIGAAAILMAWLAALGSQNASAALVSLDRVLDSVMMAILFFLGLLMVVMGRLWTRYEFGVAFGFGLNAAGFLITSTTWIRAHYRPTSLDQLPVIAYDLCILVWLYCFSSPQKPAVELTTANAEIVQQAHSWEKAVKQLITPKKNNSGTKT